MAVFPVPDSCWSSLNKSMIYPLSKLSLHSAKVAVIVLNWNGWRDTINCLNSILNLDNECIGVVVCDNASSDDSVAQIRNWITTELPHANNRRASQGRKAFRFLDHAIGNTVRHSASNNESVIGAIALIQSGWNGGYAAGNNVGMRYAFQQGADYCWILNNDTSVREDALSWLIARVTEDPSIGICGSTVVYADGSDRIQTCGGARFLALKGRGSPIGENRSIHASIDHAAVEVSLNYINGASMFVSRKLVESIGFMREDYFLYWEEIDWATRAKGTFKLGYAPRSIVYHKVGASIGTNDFGESSTTSEYYMTTSRLKFCMRFSKLSIPFILADVVRDIVRYGSKGKWRRAGNLARALLRKGPLA